MQLSTERILTTHTGSLPRPAGLSLTGPERDAGQLAEAVRSVVKSEVDAGVDVVNDGEASKVGYSTYVTERLTGFGGHGEPLRPKDYDDFPAWGERLMSERARTRRLTNAACIGPVAYDDTSLVQADIDNLRQATAGQEITDVFMSAASPGVIAVFLANQYYPSDEEYIGALADAMKTEYDAIHAAGLVLQLDCPDLAMGWNVSGIGGTQEGFLVEVGRRVAAINHATRDIPPEAMRLHLCWGNYEGPHTRDIPLHAIIGEVLKARPAAISFEGANPRHEHEWAVFEDVRLPDGKAIIPGVIDSTTNYVEHPELVAQRSSATPAWSAGRTSWPVATAGSPRSPPRPRSTPRSRGRSWRRWPREPGWRARRSGPDGLLPSLPALPAPGYCSLLWSQETTRVGSTT
jgi:5-methyltetrahydropteroyltriglutamate--homocysteine methyltransferase